ncbi:MAG: ATPase [Candidatus Aenigmatarchaeota archaeon]|nr:MAG: ATPase [Candidatus Aenigmarchaeota archaeon]
MKGKYLAFVAFLFVTLALSTGAYAQEEAGTGGGDMLAIGAGIAMGLCAIGAGYGIGKAGSAAMGAIAEKSETATWGLIIVALAEGIALYGLIIAFLLVTKI